MTTPKESWEERFDERFPNLADTSDGTDSPVKSFIKEAEQSAYERGLAEGHHFKADQTWDASRAETLKEIKEIVEKKRIVMVQHENDDTREGLRIAGERFNEILDDLLQDLETLP